MFEWLVEPTAWLGLFSLIILEIVLGIDNLIFIAILADKLPPAQRDKARVIGLGLALIMRLVLLAGIAWLVTLTQPLFSIFTLTFSGRDLILLVGGLFLLFKATTELHERLEGDVATETAIKQARISFGVVIAQIVVLDAVFSIDSMITAVGMTNELSIMMIAVTVAIILMMIASKPLSAFVNAHPTVIILCLSFLLMIGFSLIADGFGFNIPKGYLYAAIGFSVLIEAFNQLAKYNRQRAFLLSKTSMRDRTADAVLRLLGGNVETESVTDEVSSFMTGDMASATFDQAERGMIRNVFSLAERTVRSIMTPRPEADTLYDTDDTTTIKQKLLTSPFSRLPVMSETTEEPIGFIQKKDILNILLEKEEFPLLISLIRDPLIVPENKTVLKMLESFKQHAAQVAFVVDEFGGFEGIVTLNDVVEAIAGEIPEEYEATHLPYIHPQEDRSYLVDGRTDIEDLRFQLELEIPRSGDFHTVAGLVLDMLQTVPNVGDTIHLEGWKVTVIQMDGMRISQLLFEPTLS